VLVHRLPRPVRIPYAVTLLLVFGLLAFVLDKTFTDFGHFVSVLIGFAIYPVVHSRSVDDRAHIPLYRPWLSR
jgi:cytosine/uracil/thiamine/allantoin permease